MPGRPRLRLKLLEAALEAMADRNEEPTSTFLSELSRLRAEVAKLPPPLPGRRNHPLSVKQRTRQKRDRDQKPMQGLSTRDLSRMLGVDLAVIDPTKAEPEPEEP